MAVIGVKLAAYLLIVAVAMTYIDKREKFPTDSITVYAYCMCILLVSRALATYLLRMMALQTERNEEENDDSTEETVDR
jgi:hypothetical protein